MLKFQNNYYRIMQNTSQLIQFERVKIESSKNQTEENTLIHLSCLSNERDIVANKN